MNALCNKYQNILLTLEQCENCYGDKNRVEAGFQNCYRVWSDLQREITTAQLDTKEIIILNKTVQAVLLSKIEYYTLHYHALLFCPCGRKKIFGFWRRESLRLEKFRKDHTAFYHYHQSGDTHLDAYYYGHLLTGPLEASCPTLLRGKLLALQQYLPYARMQMVSSKNCH